MEKKKKIEEEKKLQPSLSTEIVGEKKPDTINGKKMEEEVLDDGKKWLIMVICRIDVSLFPVHFSCSSLQCSKHPMLFAVFIPDNTSREIIYVNKKQFVIARRHNADYVVIRMI